LEIKSVVVHFQGKTINPEWKITENLLTWPFIDVTKLMHLGRHQQDLGEGSTDKGGVNWEGKPQ
jgi:hypothetical protein